MSKAILILEKPNSCSECPLFCGHYSDMSCGGLNNRGINYPYPKDFRQDWCPLKELPEKQDLDISKITDRDYLQYAGEYESGWNACLNEILGE